MQLRKISIATALFAMAFSGAASAAPGPRADDGSTAARSVVSEQEPAGASTPKAGLGYDIGSDTWQRGGRGDLLRVRGPRMQGPPSDNGARR